MEQERSSGCRMKQLKRELWLHLMFKPKPMPKHMLKIIYATILLIVISPGKSFADETFPVKDVAISTPPKSVYSISIPLDGAILGVTGLFGFSAETFDKNIITRRCPCNPNEVNPFDRHVIGNANNFLDGVSDVTAVSAVIAPALWSWYELRTTTLFFEDMTVYAEVISVNTAMVSLAKLAAQRPLPRVYADPNSDLAQQPGGFRSFYSGHTSTTFAALSAASMTAYLRHGASIWPWFITAAIGTSVGLERVAAGRHFYTDVIFGALSGTAVGTLIPLLHSKKFENPSLITLTTVQGDPALTWIKRF